MKKRIIALMIASFLLVPLFTLFPTSVVSENDDEMQQIRLYFHENGIMDTIPPTNTAPTITADNVTFRINNTLLDDFYTVNITVVVFVAKQHGLTAGTPNVTIEIYDNNILIANKSFSDVNPLYYPAHEINMNVGEYTFAKGHIIKVSIYLKNCTLAYDATSRGSGLIIEGKSITDVCIETRNVRGERTDIFYPNDWPYGIINISGKVLDVFGSGDIKGIRVNITHENDTVAQGDATILPNGTYFFVWNYSNVEVDPGLYTCSVTIFDMSGNAVNASVNISMVEKGIVLTSPSQTPEGYGPARGTVSVGGNTSYVIRVRNVGKVPLRVHLLLTGQDASLGRLSKRDINVTEGGCEELSLEVDSDGKPAYSTINITVYAYNSDYEYTLFTITYVSPYSFALSPEKTNDTVVAGKNATFTISVINTGVAELKVNLTAETNKDGWHASLSANTIKVEKDKTVSVTLSVSTPSALHDDFEVCVVEIKGVCVEDENITANTSVSVRAVRAVWMEAVHEDLTADVGREKNAEITLILHNMLNETKSFSLYVDGLSDDWNIGFSPSSKVTVKAEGSVRITFTAYPSKNVRAGDYPIKITATVPQEPSLSAHLEFTIINVEYHSISVGLDKESIKVALSQNTSILLSLGNTGNVDEHISVIVNLTKDGVLYDWVSVEEESFILSLNARKNITISINVPNEAQEGEYILNIVISYGGGERHENATVIVERTFVQGLIHTVQSNWVPIILFVIILGMVVFARRKK